MIRPDVAVLTALLAIVVFGIAALIVVDTAAPPTRMIRTRRPSSDRLRARAAGALTRVRPPPRLTPDAIATWCESLSREVRSGATLTTAIRSAQIDDAALMPIVNGLRSRLDRGASLSQAVRATIDELDARRRDRRARAGLIDALTVIGVVAQLGGSAAGPLARVESAQRLRVVDRQERQAHAAQARMSAHVLTVVPVAFLGLLVVVDPGVRVAASSGIGVVTISAGMTLNALGWWWMHRTIDASTR